MRKLLARKLSDFMVLETLDGSNGAGTEITKYAKLKNGLIISNKVNLVITEAFNF